MTDPPKWVIHGERLVDDTPHVRVNVSSNRACLLGLALAACAVASSESLNARPRT